MRTALAALLTILLSCLPHTSKVRSGQLYSTGTEKYDAYFKEVHALQQQSANWDDERGASRRPLADALKLDPGAADVTVVQSTHEHMIAAAHEVGATRLDAKDGEAHMVCAAEPRMTQPTRELFHALEAVVKSELERAKALRAIPPKIDALTHTAHDLSPDEDFGQRSRAIARDVADEVNASVEALGTLSARSRNLAREADDFVALLGRAAAAQPTEPLPKDATLAPPPGAKGKPVAPPPRPGPAVATAAPPPQPKPKPPPQPPPDEVFNP